MSTVTASEARSRFGELLERVGLGEEVVITRHDKVVARIVPGGPPSQAQTRLSDAEARSAIEDGRR